MVIVRCLVVKTMQHFLPEVILKVLCVQALTHSKYTDVHLGIDMGLENLKV